MTGNGNQTTYLWWLGGWFILVLTTLLWFIVVHFSSILVFCFPFYNSGAASPPQFLRMVPRALALWCPPKGPTPFAAMALVPLAPYAYAAYARHAMRSRSSQSARAAVSGLVAPVGLERCLRLQRLLPLMPQKEGNQHSYGSIPIHTIFRVMNIYLPAILMFTREIGFWPIPTCFHHPKIGIK